MLIPEKSSGHCCGLGGADGPNMACEACGLPVASRIDDCSLWQVVWLASNAVRRHPVKEVFQRALDALLPAGPAPEVLPGGVLRDDPPAPRSGHLFRIDSGIFRGALARLPAARAPWLREILENLPEDVRTCLF